MSAGRWIADLFACIDSQDAQGFADFLADDCVFRFGNSPPIMGRADVRQAVAGFFGSIKAISHEIKAVIDAGGTIVCHGFVTYIRHDDSTLAVPFADVFALRQGKIAEYLIFADVSRL